MSAKKFFAKHMISVVVVLVVIGIGISVNQARDVADEAIIDSTFDEMEQIGKEYQVLLANTLEEAVSDLSIFAEYVVESGVGRDGIVEYITAQSHAEAFDTLYYIELDGVGVSAENERPEYFDFSENLSFLGALENELYVEAPHISLVTSEIVFDLAIPLMENDEPTAVLFCEVSVNDFFETVLQNKDYEGDIFFVDHDLNMIFSTSDNHVGSTTIPEEDVMEMGIDNVIEAQNNLQNKQSGGFYYDYFGTAKVMVYYPIELTNVALAMNVHVASLSSEIIRAANFFDVVGSTIYWTIIALVIYISIVTSRSNKRILKVAYYDPLTELPNIAKLKMDIKSALVSNRDTEYSILVFDIENFKAINEIFGYDMGDRVLKTIKGFSDTISEPSFIAARIGDDKFAMFAKSDFLDNLGAIIADMVVFYDTTVPELKDYAGTYKVGRYKIEKGETAVDEIISKVNLAHSRAKATKGEPICDYDDMFKKTLQTEAEITNKMKLALANNEFKAFLQPKFSLNEEELIGAEALVRWIEDGGKVIFPNEFIPLFERNGFIIELDKYMLEQACATIKHWMDNNLSVVPISVNCSRLNLQNPYFVSGIVAIAKKYNVPHQYIEIELTESTTIESEQAVEQLFEDLHSEGFKISIDDFGAGYSSLGMLKNLNADILKMDRSFFIGGKNARRDDMLIDSIVKMAHNLKMYVVAEGIETAEQIELLKSMNCDAAQGYYYAKPMPIVQFEEKYHNSLAKRKDDTADSLPIINHINDMKYASSFVPSGIIVTKLDEYFTLVEANDYYFDMIGYTREEVRDVFENRGTSIMDPGSLTEILSYYSHQMQADPNAPMEFTTKFTLKSGKVHTYKLSGKVAMDEHGEARLYTSVTDITAYSKPDNTL